MPRGVRKNPHSVDWAAYEDLLKRNRRLLKALRIAERTLEAWGPEDEPDHHNEDGSVIRGAKAENPALDAVRAALKGAEWAQKS